MTITHRAPQQLTWPVRIVLQRYGWLAFFVACLVLSYLSIWQRGFYTDDYSFHNNAVDITTGAWRLYLPERLDRPLAFFVDMNLAGLVPEYELFVRIVAALFAGANALLLAWLVKRLVRSRFMSIVTAWLFLSPYIAHQAVLWIAAYLYVFSLFFVLLFLHASINAFTHPQTRGWWTLAAVACYAIAVGFGEQAALSVVLVPVLAIALAAQKRISGYRSAATHCAALIAIPAVLALSVAWFGYRTAGMVATRGGMDLTIGGLLNKTAQFTDRFMQLTIRPNTGLRLTVEAGKLGVHRLIDSPATMLLFIAAFLLLLFTVRYWSNDRQGCLSVRGLLALLGVCLAWLAGATLFPGITLPRQGLTSRMLYLPLAGASVAGATAAWLIVGRLSSLRAERMIVLAAGGALLASSLCMMGYGRAYQARYALDQRQLASLKQALPAPYLPQGAYVVALELDERLFGHNDGMSVIMLGALQTRWSAPEMLNQIYQRSDLHSVARTGELAKKVEYTEAQGATPAELRVMDEPVPIDKTVLFVYKDGASRIIESLVVRQSDGARLTVRFPIAEKMAADGLPTLRNYPAPAVAAAQ